MRLVDGEAVPGAEPSVGSASPPHRGQAALRDAIGQLPYRLQLAGGWIDQPFVNAMNPEPPGSMVVASLKPTVRYMDRAGMASGTRATARALWGDRSPERDPSALVRELYDAENGDKADPSGSQDMIGLVVPGISRLDYDARVEGGVFPCHIESTCDPETVAWLERVLHLVPVAPRPAGYSPLGRRHLEPEWILRLGRSGRDCFDAILRRDVAALGASLVECSLAWDAILPDTLDHPLLAVDLHGLLAAYRSEFDGAMFSGCGGGYLIVASESEVPGSVRVTVRTA